MASNNLTLQDIAHTLRAAREAKSLSQREVSKRAGLTQAQISKAENAADLRLSNLVELARALDLEVALVPRKTVPAVESIVRAANADAPSPEFARVLRDLGLRAQEFSANMATLPELQRIQDTIKEFSNLRLSPSDFERLQQSANELRRITKSFRKHQSPSPEALRDSLSNIKEVTQRLQALQHQRPPRGEDRTQPAYTLDGEDTDD